MSQEKFPLLGSTRSPSNPSPYVLVIHGGAGTMSKEGSTPDQRADYKAALAEALRAVCIPYLFWLHIFDSSSSHRDIGTSALVGMLSTPWWLL
jgi:hypothetical protein